MDKKKVKKTKVVCTCTVCIKKKYPHPDGKRQLNGQLISYKTRLEHEERDLLGRRSPPLPPKERAKPKHSTTGTQSKASRAGPSMPDLTFAPIEKMVAALCLWLHNEKGFSRETTNRILKSLGIIFAALLLAIRSWLLIARGIDVQFPALDIPSDIRTVYNRHDVKEPVFHRVPCCPKCFTQYPNAVPSTCNWKPSPRTHYPCGEKLLRWVREEGGEWTKVPRCQYTTQDFDEWLEFFLSRKEIDEALRKTHQHIIDHPLEPGGEMRDVQDSPLYRGLFRGPQSPYNLRMPLYVDGFNVNGMRTAGKTSSCSLVALLCLNLPPDLRYEPDNVFIATVTPPPFAPKKFGLIKLLDPIMKRLRVFEGTAGVQLPTYSNPAGASVRVKVAPVIADSPARVEVCGFLTHVARFFCQWCLSSDMKSYVLNSRLARNAATVREQARKWQTSILNSERTKEEGKNGVRWSSLHFLQSWNPVDHAVLGYMHNWNHGILKAQLRTLWGIGRDKKKEALAKEFDTGLSQTEAESKAAKKAAKLKAAEEAAAEEEVDDTPFATPSATPSAASSDMDASQSEGDGEDVIMQSAEEFQEGSSTGAATAKRKAKGRKGKGKATEVIVMDATMETAEQKKARRKAASAAKRKATNDKKRKAEVEVMEAARREEDAMFDPPSPPVEASFIETVDDRTPTQATFLVPKVPLEMDRDEDYESTVIPPGAYRIPIDFLTEIRECIKNISLPTWVSRPPANLGEASHGSLKADIYQTLFAYILPVIMPELWTRSDATETDALHLKTFESLTVCTNIVASYRTSDADADLYEERYHQYREGMERLHSCWDPLPNHHWALHNGQFLRNWGPLPPLSEYFGERLIGMLQDVNTNQRDYDLDLTLIRQTCRRARLDAFMRDDKDLESLSNTLLETGNKLTLDSPNPTLTPEERSDFVGKKSDFFDSTAYNLLLGYLRTTGRPHASAFDEERPYVLRNECLCPKYRNRSHITYGDRTFSCKTSHLGNSAIQYRNTFTKQVETGFILKIWQLPIDDRLHTFFLVSPHTPLQPDEYGRAPFRSFHDKYATRIYDAEERDFSYVIESRHIISHVSTFKRNAGTYGIPKDTLIVCSALNRGRR